MIHLLKGDIMSSNAEALVNTVNTVGVMGKGVALRFKTAFPSNYKAYREACQRGEVHTGKMFVTKDSNLTSGEKTIINFPTKRDWRKSSEYEYIESGLEDLVKVITENGIKSIAIPPLGAGNGGLEWERVKRMILRKLENVDCDIYIYEPTKDIKEQLKAEKVKLTGARAMLMYVLYDLVRNGEYVSEFAGEKVCYFMQRFGAEKYFKLDFKPEFYGPYSGKVRYLLNKLNGSYIMGYSDMNKKPFEPLSVVADSYEQVKEYVEKNPELEEITAKTVKFLNGFYSDFSLELLSSLDYIALTEKTLDKEVIEEKLKSWNDRKRSLFSDDRYVEIGIGHLKKYLYN